MAKPKARPKGWPRKHRKGCARRSNGVNQIVARVDPCTCGVFAIRRALTAPGAGKAGG